ncbi:MAG: hypothetical protein D6704_05210 [Nitrospirae bacterium]|nr:MAG: hypothetical protein D6704_05210 [Nitrospirota bacterium]
MQGFTVGDQPGDKISLVWISSLPPTWRISCSRQHLNCSWLVWTLVFVVCGHVVGCGAGASTRYARVEASLLAGDPQQADTIIAEAEAAYGARDRLLYLMDRGMTLHLAGQYAKSNAMLEEADRVVEQLFTRRLHRQVAALLVNDTLVPFRGDPYEKIMISVIKALNYALLQEWDDALVEARRIDHRLNVLADSVAESSYHEDPFARYLTGLLYEAAGDRMNAFVAYRKAYEAYRWAHQWSTLTVPALLKRDLLRLAKALQMDQEYTLYREAFPDLEPSSSRASYSDGPYGRIVMLSYHGQAPHFEDRWVDIPISLEALTLVLQTKRLLGDSTFSTREIESVLYGLQGRVVRVALPHLVPHKSRVAFGTLRVQGETVAIQTQTIRVYDVTAIAKKNFNDKFPKLLVRAAARAAVKMASAEGLGIGVSAGIDDKAAQAIVRVVATALARIFALQSEEADKRSWRTLPDEIHLARVEVPPGTYRVTFQAMNQDGRPLGRLLTYRVTLAPGETRFMIARIMF